MKKNVASQLIGAHMISATDGSDFSDTVTIYITGDAGLQAIGTVDDGVCVYKGNGYHIYSPAQGETDYDMIAFTFIGSGAISVTVQVFTTFPQTGDSFDALADMQDYVDDLTTSASASAEAISDMQEDIDSFLLAGAAIKTVVDNIEDIVGNKMEITDATGAVTLYADNSSTPLLTGSVTDNSTTTTRTKLS